MKAVYITEHGGTDVLTYGDLREPEVGPNDVKVSVKACALNRLDVFTRLGVRGTRMDFTGPHVMGTDVAGEVAEAGAAVTRIRVGDRVLLNPRLTCGNCPACEAGDDDLCVSPGGLGATTNGGYAEYVTAPAVNVVHLPDSLTYIEAASLPTVFMPAWTILIRRGNLKPWETSLVLSASSGVGTAAIQVAKNIVGATVIATTSNEEKASKAQELGADSVINYTKEDIAARVKELTSGRGVDVVVDHVGSEFWPAASASLARGGRYGICGVTTGYRADLQMGRMFLQSQTIFGTYMGRKADLTQIVQMADKGLIRGIVHGTFPLKNAAEAHRVMEERSFFGKLVLTIK